VAPPPPPTVPAAPNLTGATPGDGQVALAWTTPADGGSGITGYEVWRSLTSGTEAFHTLLPVQNTFTDTGLTNGTTYFYVVKAVNSVGLSPPSNERSATPVAPPPPPPPTVPSAPVLTAAVAGDARVDLSWTPPTADGGSAITGYQIWRAEGGDPPVALAPIGVTTAYPDTGLTNGVTYTYQVAAINAVGTGAPSNALAATPVAPAPTVTRTGGAVSMFDSASSATGSMPFALPAGSDRLVALVSMNSIWTRATAVTWKPDPADPSQDQAMRFVGRQLSSGSKGSVEIWELADPNPGATGSAVSHVLSGSARRVMGLHALAGVASVGAPVGIGAYARPIQVTVGSEPGALVLDVLYGQNTTTSYTAGAGQSSWWNTATGGINGLRSAGSSEVGASSVVTSWTAGATTNLALLAVSFNPTPGPPSPPTVVRTGGAVSSFSSASGPSGSMAFSLPGGSNRMVALVSLIGVSARATAVSWTPNPADPSQDQAFTFVARQMSSGSKGAVEIWELANPTPGVAGSAVSHVLSGSTARIFGLHALAGVASVGTPVGVGTYAKPIGVTVSSESGALVLDVLYGLNSTTSYTAGAGQDWWWNYSAHGLRSASSVEAGASSVVMSWTAGATTHMALLAVSFNPTP
jgi:hypothetical protein